MTFFYKILYKACVKYNITREENNIEKVENKRVKRE